MNENIQLVDLGKIGDELDTELLREEILKRFEKIQAIDDRTKIKIYFKKHHKTVTGSAKYEVNVKVDTPKKSFQAGNTDFSVIDAVTSAMDSAEKETRKYFDKKKSERINSARF
ncbi:MAG: hypothetical protein GQ477_06125 [Nanohaloarchaea archaeon]|nr:hypothetical protein [Candidatus Nanohaloarchaea archaeon]